METTYLVAEIERATPWAVHVAAVAGVVLGFLGGWMLFGWASRRTEGRPAVQALASVMFTLVLLLWGVPRFVVPPMLLAHHLGEPHPRWHQLWEWIGLPSFAFIFVVGLLRAARAGHRGAAAVAGARGAPGRARLTRSIYRPTTIGSTSSSEVTVGTDTAHGPSLRLSAAPR